VSPRPHLTDAVWDLLNEASRVYHDSGRASTWLRDHLYRFGEPLRIAVTGRANAGKSTVVNLLVGEDVAPVEIGGEPLIWYQDGSEPRVTVYPEEGPAHDVPVARHASGLRLDVPLLPPGAVNEVVVELPVRALRHAQLIDTPAVTPSLSSDASVSRRVLRDADAVLYLVRQVGAAELGFLRSAQKGSGPLAAPINMLVVLTHADEVSGGGIDALGAARHLARRQRREPHLYPLAQNVVALAPLIARTATTLTDSEFLALAALADVTRADLEGFLLSTDRFTGGDFPVPLDTTVRAALLDRLGLFGVRLAVTLIRTGSHTREKVADQLTRRSGLIEVRESIREFFLDRRHVLKARTALLALDLMLRGEPREEAEPLRGRLERLLASTHDFQELRTLAALRTRRVTLPDPLAEEARRLLGADGTSIPARLGLESSDDDLWHRLHDALGRWQQETRNTTNTADERRVAMAVVRSCEGMLSHFD
jgi:hypothetical protein